MTDLSVRGSSRHKTRFFCGRIRPPLTGAFVAARVAAVVRRALPGHPYSLDDGLGIRRVEYDGRAQTEVLALAPVLANHPIVEQAIRSRVSRYAGLDMRSFAPVRRFERTGPSLHIVTEMPTGVRLSHLLAHLETTGEVVGEPAIFELVSLVINAVASLHAWPGGFAHGAINPSHILLTHDSRVVLTDGIFGAGLEALQRNREALWKEFRLAMPPAANLARFDKQTDVTQMGAVILALLLQRPLRSAEYPRGVSDLVVTATESASMPGSSSSRPAARMWLQAALQIHSRIAFRSAVEAQRSFSEVASTRDRSEGAIALQVLMHTVCAEPADPPPPTLTAPPRPTAESRVPQVAERRSGAFPPSRPSTFRDSKAR